MIRALGEGPGCFQLGHDFPETFADQTRARCCLGHTDQTRGRTLDPAIQSQLRRLVEGQVNLLAGDAFLVVVAAGAFEAVALRILRVLLHLILRIGQQADDLASSLRVGLGKVPCDELFDLVGRHFTENVFAVGRRIRPPLIEELGCITQEFRKGLVAEKCFRVLEMLGAEGFLEQVFDCHGVPVASVEQRARGLRWRLPSGG